MKNDQKIGRILGELESEIMDVIWQIKKPASVREVTQVLQRKRTIAYTTIMTVMGRLTEKGLLKRISTSKVYLYTPIYSKDKFLIRTSKQIIRNFISSFGDAAVAHFTEELAKISPEKRKQLLKLLKEKK